MTTPTTSTEPGRPRPGAAGYSSPRHAHGPPSAAPPDATAADAGRGTAPPRAGDGPGRSVTADVCESADLSAADRAAMRHLLDRHFAGVTAAGFDGDLADKTHALRLHDAAGALVGFSTFAVYPATVGGRRVTVVCSGDTIVDPSAWGAAALPREWIAAVRRLAPAGVPVHWLLITGGFRTYRLLPTFWRTFYPRHDEPTPVETQAELNQLAGARFGGGYDPETGVVRLPRPQVLRPHLAGVPAGRAAADPHVAFFARRNPGHGDGDELACLCELADENLTRAGRRMVFGVDAAGPVGSAAANGPGRSGGG